MANVARSRRELGMDRDVEFHFSLHRTVSQMIKRAALSLTAEDHVWKKASLAERTPSGLTDAAI
jgi:hypothetical protein